ncbi:thiol-disulfide oxidoreductase ResA [bacterium BMS3Abin08]|nr:thiol-disulfide oxidoreductase ResA [bacterium BMS3Abin08]
MKTRNIIWIVLLLILGIYLFPSIKNRVVSAKNNFSKTSMAPGFSLKDLSGKEVHLSDFKDEVVLINFWASWCPPCKIEIPGFEKIYSDYNGRGFTIIGISVDSVSQSFIRNMGMTYPVVMANKRVLNNYGKITGIPTSFLIGRDGKIIKKVVGVYSESRLRNDVENALKDPF